MLSIATERPLPDCLPIWWQDDVILQKIVPELCVGGRYVGFANETLQELVVGEVGLSAYVDAHLCRAHNVSPFD